MLSSNLRDLSDDNIREIANKTKTLFLAALREMQISNIDEDDLVNIYIPLAGLLRQHTLHKHTPVIGINGAQGAGKSSLCHLLEIILTEGFGQRVASLSIDDLYLTRSQRQNMAQQFHPLFITRGVPGTHDVQLGLALIKGLRQLGHGQSMNLPVFDKATDDRCDPSQWRTVTGPIDLILFEGWCVGARPQTQEDLAEPINLLEKEEDPDLVWRSLVNQRLTESYQRLFAELDILVMLTVPGMESVYAWRALQERRLSVSRNRRTAQRIMDEKALERFIMHYERLTRWMLAEMPGRADVVLEVNCDHRISGIRVNRTD